MIRSAVRRPVQTCRVLRDPGPSSLHIQQARSLLVLASPSQTAVSAARRRTFISSPAAGHPRPSSSIRYPRWINTRRNAQSEEQENAEEENAENGEDGNKKEEDKDGTVKMEGEEDSKGSSTSSSSASPPGGSGIQKGREGLVLHFRLHRQVRPLNPLKRRFRNNPCPRSILKFLRCPLPDGRCFLGFTKLWSFEIPALLPRSRT